MSLLFAIDYSFEPSGNFKYVFQATGQPDNWDVMGK